MTPHAFLNLLWQEKPADHYILLWTLPDKRSHWFQDVTKAAEFAVAAAADKDVYVGVGLSRADYGPSRRCKSDEVSGLAGIGTDLDLLSDAHKKALPATIPDALKILPAEMPPSVLISTGNGIHTWWLFKEPLIFDNDEERQAAARLLTRWHRLLARNATAHGWSYDKLSDLARILRIPGTRNLKDPANPKEVTVLHDRASVQPWGFRRIPGTRRNRGHGSAGTDRAGLERAIRQQADRRRSQQADLAGSHRRLDARGHAIPEHVAAAASRSEGPEPERLRSRPGLLRNGCGPVRAGDRDVDHPAPDEVLPAPAHAHRLFPEDHREGHAGVRRWLGPQSAIWIKRLRPALPRRWLQSP